MHNTGQLAYAINPQKKKRRIVEKKIKQKGLPHLSRLESSSDISFPSFFLQKKKKKNHMKNKRLFRKIDSECVNIYVTEK